LRVCEGSCDACGDKTYGSAVRDFLGEVAADGRADCGVDCSGRRHVVFVGGAWRAARVQDFSGRAGGVEQLAGYFSWRGGVGAAGGDSVGDFGADCYAGGAGFIFDAGVCAGARLDVCRSDGDRAGTAFV